MWLPVYVILGMISAVTLWPLILQGERELRYPRWASWVAAFLTILWWPMLLFRIVRGAVKGWQQSRGG